MENLKKNPPFQILSHLPAYGKMYFPFPKENLSEGLVVEFTKDDGVTWVANFEFSNDQESISFISELSNGKEIIVVANEIAYLIDRNVEAQVLAFKGLFQKAIQVDGFVILISNDCIVVIKNSKEIKFINDLNFMSSHDISVGKDFINVEILNNSLAIYEAHTIKLNEIKFDDIFSSNYYQTHKIIED